MQIKIGNQRITLWPTHSTKQRQDDTPQLAHVGTILSKNTCVSFRTGDNNNFFITGASGSGKTRDFVLPNILQMNACYVVADPGGTIYRKTAGVLKSNDFDIKVLNLNDPKHSMHYNPLLYINDENTICHFSQAFLSKMTRMNRTHYFGLIPEECC